MILPVMILPYVLVIEFIMILSYVLVIEFIMILSIMILSKTLIMEKEFNEMQTRKSEG
jgi:hypothetical protein